MGAHGLNTPWSNHPYRLILRAFQFAVLCTAVLLPACSGPSETERLFDELQSEDVQARRAAAQELGRLKIDRDDVRHALQATVDDPDRDVRRLSCFALGEIGGDHHILNDALSDPELAVRMAAAYALLKHDPGNSSAAEVLKQAMHRGDGGVIVAVTRKGAEAIWAVPTLIQLLHDRRPGIRRLAADGLGKIGDSSPAVLSALEQAEHDRDDRVRETASQALVILRR